MSTLTVSRRFVALSLSTLALLLAATLWSLGALAPVRPLPVRLLLVGSVAAATLAVLAGPARGLEGPARFAVRVAFGVSWVSSVLFVALFLLAPGRTSTGGWDRGAAGDPAVAPRPLRVVSFNVLHDYPRLGDPDRRTEALARAVAGLDADVLLLQEAWCFAGSGCLHERLSSDLEMGWAWTSANGSPLIGFEEGCAILSRYPLADVARWDLRPRLRPWRRRVALHARLDLPEGPLRLVCAHLENAAGAVASAQAADLADRLGDARDVLVGADLNLDGASDGVQALVEVGLVDLVPDGIDHVLLSATAGWRVVRSGERFDPSRMRAVGESPLSDHPALVVELERR